MGYWDRKNAINAARERDRSYGVGTAGDIGTGGSRGLREQILGQFFPELQRQRGARGPVESAFTEQATTPGALYGAAKTSAEGYASELFAPGGQISSLIRGVRGKTIGQGFAPEAGEGAELGVLRSGTQAVGNRFAQEASQLEQTRFAGLGSLYGSQQQMINDLMQSLFTGTATAEQLALAKESQKKGFFGKIFS